METQIPELKRLHSGNLVAGRYQIRELIGMGAMSSVYKAADSKLEDEIVALKVLHPTFAQDPSAFARFRNEVLIARKLTHHNIVRIFDFGDPEHSDVCYISMEYVNGMTLEKRIAEHKNQALSLDEIYYILYQISQGLAHAHENEIIHRDLKPANILIGEYGQIKIADFGIATLLNERNRITAVGECVGTPHYMSPEQIIGEKVDARSDIYSLGIMAYELLTGEVPFPDQTWYNLAARHLNTPMPPLDKSKVDAPRWFKHLLKKCTAKKPHARFQSMEQVARVISRHLPKHQVNPAILIGKRKSRIKFKNLLGFLKVKYLMIVAPLIFLTLGLNLVIEKIELYQGKKIKKPSFSFNQTSKPTWKCEVNGKTYFTDAPEKYAENACKKI